MSDLIFKPRQKTDFVVRRGWTVVFRSDNSFQAWNVAQHTENSTITFRSQEALDRFCEEGRP